MKEEILKCFLGEFYSFCALSVLNCSVGWFCVIKRWMIPKISGGNTRNFILDKIWRIYQVPLRVCLAFYSITLEEMWQIVQHSASVGLLVMIPLENPKKVFSFIKRKGIVLLYCVNQSTGQVLLLGLGISVPSLGMQVHVSVLKCKEMFS